MTKRITIEIGPDGTMHASTTGIKGSKCLDELPVIQALTGAHVVDSQLSTEYYERESAEETVEVQPAKDVN